MLEFLLIPVVAAGAGLLIGVGRGSTLSRVLGTVASIAAIGGLWYVTTLPSGSVPHAVYIPWALWFFAAGLAGPSLDQRFQTAAIISVTAALAAFGVGFYVLAWLSCVTGGGCL